MRKSVLRDSFKLAANPPFSPAGVTLEVTDLEDVCLQHVPDMEESKVDVFSLDPPSSRVGMLLGWVGMSCISRAERPGHLSWFAQLRKQCSLLPPLPKSMISKGC